jgi:hypothetical protein
MARKYGTWTAVDGAVITEKSGGNRAISPKYTCTCGWRRENCLDPHESINLHLDEHQHAQTERENPGKHWWEVA